MNKMNLRTWGILCVLTVLGCSCKDSLSEGNADSFLRFVCLKESTSPETRVSTDEKTGQGEFSDGDEISLFVDGSSSNSWKEYKLQMESGGWTGVKKEDMGAGLTTIVGCYPALQQSFSGSSLIRFSLPLDQSDAATFMRSDLLGVNRTINMSSAPSSIELVFRHLLHRLDINLSGLPNDDAAIKVEVSSCPSFDFDMFVGEIQPAKGVSNTWVTACPMGAGRYSAIVCPQQFSAQADWIRITVGKKTYAYQFPGKINGSSKLESGKVSSISLTFTERPDDPLDAEFANSAHWLYGCKKVTYNPLSLKTYDEPQDYPKGEWFKIQNKSSAYLVWEENSGWYDCDKVNPSPDDGSGQILLPGYHDWKMCWAASASNLLHWWMTLNADYIRKYDEKYGTDLYPDYPRPSATFFGMREYGANNVIKKTESEIFDYFRDHCTNMSSSANFGVDWFISGLPGEVPTNSPVKGYFSKLFPGMSVTQHTRYPRKEAFNQIIKTAIRNHQGLGMGVNMPSIGSHDMVMWGAEFDERGCVSAVYYTDSNDYYDMEIIGGKRDFQHHLCIRKEVEYDENYVYLGTGKKVRIMSLNSVDLGTDIWVKEFGHLNN